MRVSKNLPDHLAPIVETIVRGYQPEKIILFGSLVSGRGHRARDIDLLVITSTPKEELLKEISADIMAEIKPIIMTQVEYAHSAKRDAAFFSAVERDKIELGE